MALRVIAQYRKRLSGEHSKSTFLGKFQNEQWLFMKIFYL
jgi:hypothetical protein